MIDTILIPLDGSALSERALPVGCELAAALQARIVLACAAGAENALDLHFTEEDRRAIAEKYEGVTEEEHLLSTDPRMVEHAQAQVRAVAEAEQYLANQAASLREQGFCVETAVPFGPAAEGILTEIELHAAGLVVMATHGRSTLFQLVAGSVARAVLAHSPVPVLIVPPDR